MQSEEQALESEKDRIFVEVHASRTQGKCTLLCSAFVPIALQAGGIQLLHQASFGLFHQDICFIKPAGSKESPRLGSAMAGWEHRGKLPRQHTDIEIIPFRRMSWLQARSRLRLFLRVLAWKENCIWNGCSLYSPQGTRFCPAYITSAFSYAPTSAVKARRQAAGNSSRLRVVAWRPLVTSMCRSTRGGGGMMQPEQEQSFLFHSSVSAHLHILLIVD